MSQGEKIVPVVFFARTEIYWHINASGVDKQIKIKVCCVLVLVVRWWVIQVYFDSLIILQFSSNDGGVGRI